MNKRYILVTVVVVLILGFGLGRCSAPGESGADSGAAPSASAESAEATIWTCSMHPQIRQPGPGDCPICGMDLIPLEDDAGAGGDPRVLRMSDAARALADIQTSTVERGFPETELRLVGELDYDETRVKSLTARFPARIDELFVNFTGIRVEAGDHLAEVYSPELLSAQRELLTAHRADPDGSITRAAREKLRLWDLLPDQIDAIIESGEARDRFVLRAPIGGVVVAKNVKEGDYVETGEPLFKIVDLSELWAYLDAYESDLSWLRYGQDVSFSAEAFPGETFTGRIVFIDPEVNRRTRTVPVRVNVANPKGRLKPGMFVRGQVAVRIARNGKVYAPEMKGKWISPMHPEVLKDGPGQCDVCGMDLVPAEELGYVEDGDEAAPIVVPASAVLRTGKRAVVYVEIPDAERPTYEGREIVLGPRAGDSFLVESGLDSGERVVTNGAFKIDSALQIQAKPSMMSEAGQGATGVEHRAKGEAHEAEKVAVAPEDLAALLPAYLALQQALAADDLEASKAALKEIMAAAGHQGALAALVHAMLAEEELEGIRRPHFEILSDALIAAVEQAAASADFPTLYQMHCPMVYDDRGADWLQDSEQLRNPYFGAMMLRCGEIKETMKRNASAQETHNH